MADFWCFVLIQHFQSRVLHQQDCKMQFYHFAFIIIRMFFFVRNNSNRRSSAYKPCTSASRWLR